MAFDPFSWAIGYVLKYPSDLLVGKIFSEKLPQKINKVVNNWSTTLPDELSVFPGAIFPEMQKTAKEGSALYTLRNTLHEGQIPDWEIWFNALSENRKIVASSQKSDDLQNYFIASESMVKPYLIELAKEISKVCQQDEKLFHLTIYEDIQNIKSLIKEISPQLSIGKSTGKSNVLVVMMPENLKDSSIDKAIKDFGIETDIKYLSVQRSDDKEEFCSTKSRVRPLHIGLGIGISDSGATLGAFVMLPNREPGILIPAHILRFSDINPNENQNNLPVQQPMSNKENNDLNEDTIAFIWDFDRKFDIAFARLKYGIGYLGNVIPSGYDFPFEGQTIKLFDRSIHTLMEQQITVFKIGARTGFTEGQITVISLDNMSVNILGEEKKFNNLFAVESPFNERFSDHGDSGGLVFTHIDNCLYALGLLLAGGISTDSNGVKKVISYCISIDDILAANDNIKWLT